MLLQSGQNGAAAQSLASFDEEEIANDARAEQASQDQAKLDEEDIAQVSH